MALGGLVALQACAGQQSRDTSKTAPRDRSGVIDFEEVWRIREEEIYPRLFGPKSDGIYVVNADVLRRLKAKTVDPRWLTHGVFRFAPTATRNSWLCVTSGLSNPWETEPRDYSPTDRSGSGVELVLQTHEKSDWAVRHLRNLLAYQLLLLAGQFPGREPLDPGDRVSFGGPIDGSTAGPVTVSLATAPEGIAPSFTLPSGRVEFVHFTGITDSEAAFARAGNKTGLIGRLRARGYHPVTVPRRPTVA